MDNSWTLMRSTMRAREVPRALAPGTLRRIVAFARPHSRALIVFLALSTVSAVFAVATPVLAGRVVDAIVGRSGTTVVVGLALLIAVLAVLDAGVGLASRWQSARIGEGLILDLRRAVYEHVQRMPVAFFTRTRTGALVSRLNNDVIGAQTALTSTLSGLVTNVIQLVLTLAVMLTLSWQVTTLALILLPVFVLPARRMGIRLADLRREASRHNAAMTTQMTERFSAPG
ncbi:MAG TPA: ABC transporter transmembrane domain-containing protein, partial [Pseudonocardiaceae bacterium]|nr:ABC transporter transmembrane domain-containing protein [Pseudonocardiaceae bacterium]